MTTKTTTRLDAVISEVTAFDSWPEMKERLDAGYVPTIHGRTPAEKALVKSLDLLGYKSFDGFRNR